MEIFEPAWAESWQQEINRSAAYRQAAAAWQGSLALEMTGLGAGEPNGRRAVYVDLGEGSCRRARTASPADLENADFVISADREIWRKILQGRAEPILWLMTGRLKLVRGELSSLVPWVRAAKELVVAAGRVGGTFPGD